MLEELKERQVAGRTWLDSTRAMTEVLRRMAGRKAVGEELVKLLRDSREHVKVGRALPVKVRCRAVGSGEGRVKYSKFGD